MQELKTDKKRVVTLGEALVDLVADEPRGAALQATRTFQRAAGGAPANVAVGVARLGTPAGFIGAVGSDPFGRFLKRTLQAEGVDTSQVAETAAGQTALAFVSHSAGGERGFLFYRQNAADLQLRPEDVNEAYVANAAVLHVGSLSLTAEPARAATLTALAFARGHGVPRSVDPNLRLDQWPDAQAAREAIRELLSQATLVKLSAEELEFLTGDTSPATARALLHDELQLLCVTRGAAGVEYHTQARSGYVHGWRVEPVDTTGAGDAFVAALLAALAESPGQTSLAASVADAAVLERALHRATAFAALTVTRVGAIPAMPTAAELAAFMAQGERTGP